MFFINQIESQRQQYQKFLKIVGCLSNIFSDSEIPYLYYRIAEKNFCKAFEAEDLSRSDVSVDAKKEMMGIGLKTFLIGNNKSFQKVAEFNNDRPFYENLKPEQVIRKISELRNARIDFTKNTHALEASIYHCIVRDAGVFKIFEENIDRIDTQNIRLIKVANSSIIFEDGKNEYSFLLSKSTLTKRFITDSILHEFEVEILEDPLFELQKFFAQQKLAIEVAPKIKQTIYLPLYGRNFTVFPHSGLNQWNAGGRKRHSDEVYIPIPVTIHKHFPEFFPDRNTPFYIKLPNNKTMKSKICQDQNKALMSYSNKELGKWILRDVLQLKDGELLNYKKLQFLGIDSVRIDKINNSEFEINFAKTGSYEQFKSTFNN